MEEILDLVDENDNVIGKIDRINFKYQDHFCRIVGIIVINSKNEIFVHQRSLNKDFNPGFYDIAFGGTVNSNEDYEQAAKRELFEESGLDEKTIFFKKIKSFVPSNVHIKYYYVKTDKEVKLNNESIEGTFMSLKDIKLMMRKEPFCADAYTILNIAIEEKIL
jgi:isopentenyl-diphosphate Delta-isomerase